MFSNTYIEIRQHCQQSRARIVARMRYAQNIRQKADKRTEHIQRIYHKVTQQLKFTRQVELDMAELTGLSQYIAMTRTGEYRSTLSSLNDKSGNLQNLLQLEADQSLELEPLSINSSKRFCELVELGYDLEQHSQEIANTQIELEDRIRKLEQLKDYLLSRFALATEQKESPINSYRSEIFDEMAGSDAEELEKILILIQELATGVLRSGE